VPVSASRKEILNKVEHCIEDTGFLMGTPGPTYADISLFAQLVCNTTFGMEGALLANSSPALREYYDGMRQHFSLDGVPKLVPGWQPFGF